MIRLAPFSLIGVLLLVTACGGGGNGSEPSGSNVGTRSNGPIPTASAASDSDPAQVVASWGGTTITMGEVEEEASAQLMRLRQQAHQTRETTLQRLIDTRLVEAAATAAGKEPDAWLQEQVSANVTEPTDAEVQAFFDENSQRINRPLAEVRAQIVDVLKRRSSAEGERVVIDGLREAAGVEVMFEPWRVEVALGTNPPKGTEGAPITIVEFSDFQCGYCARVGDTVSQILEEYDGQVSFYFRDFPLPNHRQAPKASEAARCAGEQGKFWEMHDHLFENQRALQVENLKTYASAVGLDSEAFNTCIDSGRHGEAVETDKADGSMAGVSGTPGFFINGRFVNGAQPFENFKTIIDEELARLGS